MCNHLAAPLIAGTEGNRELLDVIGERVLLAVAGPKAILQVTTVLSLIVQSVSLQAGNIGLSLSLRCSSWAQLSWGANPSRPRRSQQPADPVTGGGSGLVTTNIAEPCGTAPVTHWRPARSPIKSAAALAALTINAGCSLILSD